MSLIKYFSAIPPESFILWKKIWQTCAYVNYNARVWDQLKNPPNLLWVSRIENCVTQILELTHFAISQIGTGFPSLLASNWENLIFQYLMVAFLVYIVRRIVEESRWSRYSLVTWQWTRNDVTAGGGQSAKSNVKRGGECPNWQNEFSWRKYIGLRNIGDCFSFIYALVRWPRCFFWFRR